MFDSENSHAIPSSQDWGQHWTHNSSNYFVDPKRVKLFSEPTGSNRNGSYYWQYMNHCAQQEGMGPKPGVESWPYLTSAAPTMSASGTPGPYLNRNMEIFPQGQQGQPGPLRPHHLFATSGGPIPLSEGGPPSLPPSLLFHPFNLPMNPQERGIRGPSRYPWETAPPFSGSHNLRQRAGVDTPPRFNGSGNTIYPPSASFHYDSVSTGAPPSTLPYYSASAYGMSSGNFRSQTNLQPGMQNPDTINYSDHGCFSLPVTTSTCDNQNQISQINRPNNFTSTSVTKQNAAPVVPTISATQKRGHHRRSLSDPGLTSQALSESNANPSNPPPPPPPLRLDGWLKGKTNQGLINRRFGERSPVIPDANQWFNTSDDRKEHRLDRSKTEEEVMRSNASGNSSSSSDLSGVILQPSKLGSNTQHTKGNCCCSSWSNSKKLAEEVTALKEANRRIFRELRETKKELDDLKVMLPNPGSLKHSNGLMGWMYPEVDYQPGMISELVQEVREAARVREEAFLSHMHSSIVSQGSSCGCGHALFKDVEDIHKKKLSCWWWDKSHSGQTKIRAQASPPTCSSLNSTVSASKNKFTSGLNELESLKEKLQQVQDEKELTEMRLKRLEDEIKGQKLIHENHIQNSFSLQESDLKKIDKITQSEEPSLIGNKSEDQLNQDVLVLKDDVQSLRIQLQNLSTPRDMVGQVQKIEHLAALLQKVVYPSNGISISGAGSAILNTIGSEVLFDNSQSDIVPLAKAKDNSSNSCDKNNYGTLSGTISAIEKNTIIDQNVASKSSPQSSIESHCSGSSCSNHSDMDINPAPPPVKIHGPVTEL